MKVFRQPRTANADAATWIDKSIDVVAPVFEEVWLALRAPTGDLISNWAYSVCASLVWSLKSWMGLLTPQIETGFEIVRMEFRRFLATFINIPAQIVNTGRKLVYRFVGYMQQAPAFFGFVKRCKTLKLHNPLRRYNPSKLHKPLKQ